MVDLKNRSNSHNIRKINNIQNNQETILGKIVRKLEVADAVARRLELRKA